MEHARNNTRKYWIYFFVSLIVMIAFLIFPPLRPWFWLILPAVATSLALAMDLL